MRSYDSQKSLKDQTTILNKVIFVQKSEKILNYLSTHSSLSDYEQDNAFKPMSFAFKFQFLSNRKKPAKFLEWVGNTFKAHIDKLEKLIAKFSEEFPASNQHDYELMQKIKKIIALLPILKSKSIQLSIRPSFYLNLLDFLVCKQDLSKVKELVKDTLEKMQPHIQSQFMAFFDSEQVLNPTSDEYLISMAVVRFIRYQIIAQLRNDHCAPKINIVDIDSLKLLLRTVTHIRELINSESANALLKKYLPNLELDFMQEFLIQADRLSWVHKMNSSLHFQSLELSAGLSSLIQELQEKTSYKQSLSIVFSKVYNLSLPAIGSRLFSNVSNAYYDSEWFSLWKKFRFSEDFQLNLWTLRAPLYVLKHTGKLLDKTSKHVADLFKTSRSYVLGLGVGLYAADPYQQFQFIAANFLFQNAYEYLNSLAQLLKKYDSVTIVKSFNPNAKPFLTYYESLNKDAQKASNASANAAASARVNSTATEDTSMPAKLH